MADVLEAALLVEAGAVTEGRAAGVSAGFESGRAEGHATGVLNGFELGAEVGYAHGAATAWLRLAAEQPSLLPDRAVRGAQALRDLAEELVRVAPVDGVAALRLLADLRSRFRALAAQLGAPQPYASTHGGTASVFAAQADGQARSPPSPDGVLLPTLDDTPYA